MNTEINIKQPLTCSTIKIQYNSVQNWFKHIQIIIRVQHAKKESWLLHFKPKNQCVEKRSTSRSRCTDISIDVPSPGSSRGPSTDFRVVHRWPGGQCVQDVRHLWWDYDFSFFAPPSVTSHPSVLAFAILRRRTNVSLAVWRLKKYYLVMVKARKLLNTSASLAVNLFWDTSRHF